MSVSTYFNNKVAFLFCYGSLQTVGIIALYKILVANLAGEAKEKLFTLILLITPTILYFTLRELVIKHWGYKLSLKRTLLVSLVSCLISGTCVAILDYCILMFDFSIFGLNNLPKVSISFWSFLLPYLLWYFGIGLITAPCIYLLLRWQLNKSQKTHGIKP